eukprot:NODE_6951_length_804_cov_243.763583_g6715_i0.p1 GENE.NODE_6951_length_804_cov_243.763583_g6715_i0~~NODE_6951_length_804_cov_243.763583_g6715_i0.p1  ORF type:complete len:210 (+),score=27.16 NODE_6951_length_804_cov_243.763583_g6715_i0:76-705(+)
MPTRTIGNVYILSDHEGTLERAHAALIPVVEAFNAGSKPPDPLYGVNRQIFDSPKAKLKFEKGRDGGVALTIIAVPRNLRRLCIMDENDDDDYKAIIAQARRLGAVLIAIVGDGSSSGRRSSSGKSLTDKDAPKSAREKASALGEDDLYHPTLDNLFTLQPRLAPFKEGNLFFSFDKRLSKKQAQVLAEHLNPEFLASQRESSGLCVIL